MLLEVKKHLREAAEREQRLQEAAQDPKVAHYHSCLMLIRFYLFLLLCSCRRNILQLSRRGTALKSRLERYVSANTSLVPVTIQSHEKSSADSHHIM